MTTAKKNGNGKDVGPSIVDSLDVSMRNRITEIEDKMTRLNAAIEEYVKVTTAEIEALNIEHERLVAAVTILTASE